jgi:hypothetical protein
MTIFATSTIRHLIVAAAFMFAAAGCGSGSNEATPSQLSTYWSGSGNVETGRVDLRGDYWADWTVGPPTGGMTCVFGAYLIGPANAVVPIVGFAPKSGGTPVHALEPASYSLKIQGTCPWTLRLTPDVPVSRTL